MEILQQQVQAQSKEADVLVIPCGSMEDARKGVEAQALRIYNSTWWPVGNGAMEKTTETTILSGIVEGHYSIGIYALELFSPRGPKPLKAVFASMATTREGRSLEGPNAKRLRAEI